MNDLSQVSNSLAQLNSLTNNLFMLHLAPLITDLATILMTAAITSLVFKRLKQPVILGYMLAGFLVGPHMHIFPTVADTGSIRVWAEMGVIFMLFALGLEFSFRKLTQMGSTVAVIGVAEVLLTLLAGFILGLCWGWTPLESFFLASMLCISSTSIIIKAFEESGVKAKQFAQLVFGVLIVEDLLAIIILVLLATLGLTRQFEGSEMLFTIVKLGFYLALWLVVGLFVIPWALKELKPELSDESLLVLALGLCFMMVVAAAKVGFSAALGAFVMGSILAETDEKEKIEKIFLPIKNLFSAIFFVSIGMLIDPHTLTTNPLLIVGLVCFIIIAKIFFVTTSAMAAGQPVRTAISMGVSLSQIGEFSFIMASIGMAVGVTDNNLYANIIAASAVTTFTTPYMIRSRVFIGSKIEKIIPLKIQTFFAQYNRFSILVQGNTQWRNLVRHYLYRILINAIVIVAIFIITTNLSLRFEIDGALAAAVTLILASPFFWGILFYTSRDPELAGLIQHQLTKSFRQFLFLTRLALALLLLSVLVGQFISIQNTLILFFAIFIVASFLMSRYLGPVYIWFENRFLKQLRREQKDLIESSMVAKNLPTLAPWDAHLSQYEVPAEASYVGQSLANLHLKENFGIIVALIQRGERLITAPGRDEVLMPYDQISVIGSDDQLERFEVFLKSSSLTSSDDKLGAYALEQFLVTDHTEFVGKAIRESGIREKTKGLVVGIERLGERILNPDSSLKIQSGDLLWIAGDRAKIRNL